MKTTEAAVLGVLQQVQAFLDGNADLLQSVNSTDTRKALDDVITQLSTMRVTQGANARLGVGATAAQESAKRALLEHYMRAIVNVARAQLPTLPDLAGLTAAASGRVPNQKLLDAADSMAQVAEAHHDVFASALGTDFLDQLVAATNDVKSAATQGATHRAQQQAATAAIVTQVSRGRKLLRVLDPLVKKAVAGNAQLLADWQNRLRIEGPARGVKTSAGVPVPSTPGTTTSSQPAAAPSSAPPAQPVASSPVTTTPPAPSATA